MVVRLASKVLKDGIVNQADDLLLCLLKACDDKLTQKNRKENTVSPDDTHCKRESTVLSTHFYSEFTSHICQHLCGSFKMVVLIQR